MPNSRFVLHGKRPSLIHGLCAFFASNSRFMRLSQAPLDTPLDSPFSVTSPNVFPPQKNSSKQGIWSLPSFEGSLPSCWPHSAGYTCTSLHPYFPVAKFCSGLLQALASISARSPGALPE